MTSIHINTIGDADQLLDIIRGSAQRAHDWIAAQSGHPLDMLKQMKFQRVGFHPIEDRALNVVEQINQTWTFFVAAAAAKNSWSCTPDAGGFHLAERFDAGYVWQTPLPEAQPHMIGMHI